MRAKNVLKSTSWNTIRIRNTSFCMAQFRRHIKWEKVRYRTVCTICYTCLFKNIEITYTYMHIWKNKQELFTLIAWVSRNRRETFCCIPSCTFYLNHVNILPVLKRRRRKRKERKEPLHKCNESQTR